MIRALCLVSAKLEIEYVTEILTAYPRDKCTPWIQVRLIDDDDDDPREWQIFISLLL